MNQPASDGPAISVDDATEQRLIGRRRHLHAHPELSNHEYQTAGYIEAQLADIGITDVERVAETGVVALIDGAHDGPTLGWRADIDALPIEEAHDAAYCSQNPGVMHACGHDVHTAVGLGVAEQVYRRRQALCGRIKMIFQPAEEATPVDEPVGAEKMARAGVLDDPAVDAIFAIHCMPSLEVEKIGFTDGGVWAGSDLVEIDVHGQKSHGAYPHEGVDAVVVASQLVCALQTVVSRRVAARNPCVVTIGEIEGGTSYNILAERAQLTGIVRALSTDVASRAKREIRRLADHICAGFDADCQVRFTAGASPVVNDAQLEARAVDALRARSGPDEIVAHPPQLGAEDFAAFSRRIPACFLFLGIRNEPAGITHALHTAEFDVDERCLTFGVERLSTMLFDVAAGWQ